MNISQIPAQASVLIDANILVYHLAGVSPDCTAFLRRVALRELDSYVTTTIIAEALHRRMVGEAIAKRIVSPSQALKKLKANPEIISRLAGYIADIEALLKLPLRIIEVTAPDLAASHALRRAHGLFVNDSINLACAQRAGVSDVVTNDGDFTRVPFINIWKPTDLPG